MNNMWNVPEQWEREYLDSCLRASKYDSFFNTFKSDSHFTRILEHANELQGKNYYDLIEAFNPCFLVDYPDIWSSDEIGNPFLYKIADKNVSPTTLQYLFVASQLKRLFGSLEGFKIAEIGGGYGGQCKIINDIFSFKEYDIIDLPEVTSLQNRYLQEFSLDKRVGLYNAPHHKKGYKYDLAISNYALCEVKDPQHTEYIKDVLLFSKRGYITCNGPIPGLSLLQKSFEDLTRLDDVETERDTNYILVWGHKK